jgi:hypothetical protein
MRKELWKKERRNYEERKKVSKNNEEREHAISVQDPDSDPVDP